MQKILVTGASGFTGGYVVNELLNNNFTVRGMVRNIEKAQDLKDKGVEVVYGDLTDHASLEKAVEGVDGIIHIAAIFRQAGLPESEFMRANGEGTKALLDAAVKYKVKRFIHCSTVGVHGHIENPPGNEDTPFNPGDMYQRSKVAGEELARSYFKENKLSGVVIRPAMIYGPGDERTLKMFKMISKGIFFYVGKGESLVHFVDVRDLAIAFRLALEKTELNNRVYIVAGKETMPLKEIADRISKILEVKPPWLHLPIVPLQLLGDLCEFICTPLKINPPIYRRRVDFFTKHRSFDDSAARKDLDYEPKQESRDELKDIIQSYKEIGEIQ